MFIDSRVIEVIMTIDLDQWHATTCLATKALGMMQLVERSLGHYI